MKEHGDYKIQIHKLYLEVEVSGSWNNYTMLHFIEDFKDAAKKIYMHPWGVLADLSNWELSTPETEEPMKKLQKWCSENNQKYEATIVDTNPVKQYQMNRYLETLDREVIEQRYFTSKELAISWFNDLGIN